MIAKLKVLSRTKQRKIFILQPNFLLFLFLSILGFILAVFIYNANKTILNFPTSISDYVHHYESVINMIAVLPIIGLLTLFGYWKYKGYSIEENSNVISVVSWIISILLFSIYFYLFANGYLYGFLLVFTTYQGYILLILGCTPNKLIAKIYSYFGSVIILSLVPFFVLKIPTSMNILMCMQLYTVKSFTFSSLILISSIYPFFLRRVTKLWERILAIAAIVAYDIFIDLQNFSNENYLKPIEKIYFVLFITGMIPIILSITALFLNFHSKINE